MPTPYPLSVLVLVFPDMDLLDIVGPLEALSRAKDKDGNFYFKPTIAGPGVDKKVSTAQWATVSPDICYDDAKSSLSTYDILLVPGGPSEVVKPLVNDSNPIVQITKAFGELTRSDEDIGRPRILLSICTGAFFLAYLGLFKGWKCTTHYMAEKDINKWLEKEGGKYERTSFVDSGVLPSGVRVLDTGGITNGMDGTLYMIRRLFGTGVSDTAAAIMDYKRLERAGVEQEWTRS